LYWDTTAIPNSWQPGGNEVHIACLAGQINQQGFAVALGYNAGNNNQQGRAVAIGPDSALFFQGPAAIAIGSLTAGDPVSSQGPNAIAIGTEAGFTTQGLQAIAIGTQAGYTLQQFFATAIGSVAGAERQGENAIAIGNQAGATVQGDNAIAIGSSAGSTYQGGSAIAIGSSAGANTQLIHSIAMGTNAGLTNQQEYAIAIGYEAGQHTQQSQAIAIGYQAAGDLFTSQSYDAIAMGSQAGFQRQQKSSIAIGSQAGNIQQQNFNIAMGTQAGQYDQGLGPILTEGYSIAIGNQAANATQGSYAVAIGNQAAQTSQGDYAIAIGNRAGVDGLGAIIQFPTSIVINAHPIALQSLTPRSFHLRPTRNYQFDTVLTYDDNNFSTADPAANSFQRFEVVHSVFSMPLYTWYPPQDPTNNDPEYRSYSFTAISETFPWSTPISPGGNIICQTNQYEYYLYDCNAPPLLGTLIPLLTGTPPPSCVYNNFTSVFGCQGYVLLAYDPTGGYNYAAQFSGYWYYQPSPDMSPSFIQCSWAATLQWLQFDTRSQYTDPSSARSYRIMPLVANHTV